MAMMFSHGNANVERGFSVNGDCLWENMNEQSLVARRQVYDYVTLLGGLANIDLNSKMLLDVKSARARHSEISG
ncbi:hypothetical protein JTE90_008659 [Oedothorax gibbosus]|uniref:Uncharacterized protein n=1 Tax=Oedothorax gibbosus TaxID=931172 RepID=A0AAV6TZN5_9ARAC|nr:hypothetical protein JTE90_008659 [Oedothorax gibbosus]